MIASIRDFGPAKLLRDVPALTQGDRALACSLVTRNARHNNRMRALQRRRGIGT